MSGKLFVPPHIDNASRGASRLVDIRSGWFLDSTVGPGGAFGGTTDSKQAVNLRSGEVRAGYFNLTGGISVQLHKGLLCLGLSNSAANAASQYERIIPPPLYPPLALVQQPAGVLDARGPLVARIWWTIAFSGAAGPASDVGVTIQDGLTGNANTLTSTAGDVGSTGAGVLMVAGKMRLRVKNSDNPLTTWVLDDELDWPVALDEWCTVEFRIREATATARATLQIFLNGGLAREMGFEGTLEPIPVPGNGYHVLTKCRNRDTGPGFVYCREFGMIVGPDEPGTY